MGSGHRSVKTEENLHLIGPQNKVASKTGIIQAVKQNVSQNVTQSLHMLRVGENWQIVIQSKKYKGTEKSQKGWRSKEIDPTPPLATYTN